MFQVLKGEAAVTFIESLPIISPVETNTSMELGLAEHHDNPARVLPPVEPVLAQQVPASFFPLPSAGPQPLVVKTGVAVPEVTQPVPTAVASKIPARSERVQFPAFGSRMPGQGHRLGNTSEALPQYNNPARPAASIALTQRLLPNVLYDGMSDESLARLLAVRGPDAIPAHAPIQAVQRVPPTQQSHQLGHLPDPQNVDLDGNERKRPRDDP
ncbi:MAG: hypothetical protein WCK49_10170 [Myxococcaceae bacterium]